MYLRKRTTHLVTGIYAEFASSSSGNRLTLHLKPRLWTMARKADALMDKIEKLDPSTSMSRVTPLLEDMSK